MKKHRWWSSYLCALLGLAFVSLSAAAQTSAPDEWTWIGGSQKPNQFAVPGSLGTPAPANIPGSLSGGATWTDASGNLWLFGGVGYIEESSDFNKISLEAILNDLWKFNPSANEWTWMGGSLSPEIDEGPGEAAGTSIGVYGTLGVPSTANTPGSRTGAFAWSDKAGNLWLFGGSGFDANAIDGDLDDVWKFNPSTMEWTWMGGSNAFTHYGTTTAYNTSLPAVYGSLGTPAPGNTPGSRPGASSWTDSSGNFWLFGGDGFGPGAGYGGALNDLWEFNPSTNEWAWMGGSMAANCDGFTCGQAGTYGTLGTPAAGNIPASRSGALSWTDASGNLWLFGGGGYLSISDTEALNDLWEFNPNSGQWAWMGGSMPTNVEYSFQPSIYGTLGTPAPGNIPGSRVESTTWTDNRGNLWLLGGIGEDAIGTQGNLDDLWEFNPNTQLWAWMGGSSAFACPPYVLGPNCGLEPPVYGTLGTPSEAYLPGSRNAPSTWGDKNGNLWLFGGTNADAQGSLNDLWLYQPSSTPDFIASTTPQILPVTDTYDLPQSVTITDAMPGAFIYYTTDGVTTPTTSSNLYSGAILVSATQSIQAVAVAPNFLNSAAATANYTIDIPTTPAQIVSGLSPSTYLAGRLDFALTMNGLRFTTGSTVYWGTSALATTYVSATQLTAQVPAADVATAGITAITVQTPAPGGGTSNAFQFEVDSPNSEPTDPELIPFTATVTAGSAAGYKLTVPPSVTGASLATCLNLPAGANCSYSSATNTLTIATASTTPPGTYQVTVVFTETVIVPATSWIVLPVLLLPLMFLRRKLAARGIWVSACLMLVLLFAVFGNGCGGGGAGGGGGGGTGSNTQTEQMTGSDVVTLIVQ
jgi:N-acetylneuraminic acid mutarotase